MKSVNIVLSITFGFLTQALLAMEITDSTANSSCQNKQLSTQINNKYLPNPKAEQEQLIKPHEEEVYRIMKSLGFKRGDYQIVERPDCGAELYIVPTITSRVKK